MALQIPKTITEAKKALASLDALVTAREWERAAIVYAFTTEPGRGGPPDRAKARSGLSFGEFAGLGIAGLRSHETVAKYHRNWQYAVDLGKASPTKPGQAHVGLPTDLEWPPTGRSHGRQDKLKSAAPAESKAEAIFEVLEEPGVLDEFCADLPAAPVETRRALFDAVVADFDDQEDEKYRAPAPLEKSFDDRCAGWVHRFNKLLMDGAKLAAEAEGLNAIGGHAEMALAIHQNIAERDLDREHRLFIASEEATR